MAEMREFTPKDWDDYPGANLFDDGTMPWVGWITVDGVRAVVLVDGNGVYVETEDGTNQDKMWVNERLSKEESLAYARGLTGNIPSELFRLQGFYSHNLI